jgi:uncharacterized protein
MRSGWRILRVCMGGRRDEQTGRVDTVAQPLRQRKASIVSVPGAFVFLALAIVAAWCPPLPVGRTTRVALWMPLFAVAAATGLATDVLQPIALVSLALLVLAAWVGAQAAQPAARALGLVAAGVLALALALHLLPGFDNPVVVRGVRISADAAPYTLYLNFDKGAAGLVLLALLTRRASTAARWLENIRVALLAGVLTAGLTLALAAAAGLIRFDLKLAPFIGTFLLTNLMFTCVAEEAFFRGLLQERLHRWAAGRQVDRWLPIALSASLFGLAHAAGGLAYAAIAAVAGVGYALAYAATRRIEAAALAHFALNTAQFVAFTYPYLAAT